MGLGQGRVAPRKRAEHDDLADAVGRVFEVGRVPTGVQKILIEPPPHGFGVLMEEVPREDGPGWLRSLDFVLLRLGFSGTQRRLGFTSWWKGGERGRTAAGSSWSYRYDRATQHGYLLRHEREFRFGAALRITETQSVAMHTQSVSDGDRVLLSLEEATGSSGTRVREGSLEAAAGKLRAVAAAEGVAYESFVQVLPIKLPLLLDGCS